MTMETKIGRVSQIPFTELIKPASGVLVAEEVRGSVINNYGQTDDVVVTLPAAQEGLGFKLVLGSTAAKFVRVIDGNGKYVQMDSAVQGSAIELVSFKIGDTTYDWMVIIISGEWYLGEA